MCQHTPNTTEYQRKTHLKTQTPPKCHESGHTTGIGSAFTNDVKADPILLFLLFAQCQGTYALSRYEIRRARNRAPRATPVLPGPATPMA